MITLIIPRARPLEAGVDGAGVAPGACFAISNNAVGNSMIVSNIIIIIIIIISSSSSSNSSSIVISYHD